MISTNYFSVLFSGLEEVDDSNRRTGTSAGSGREHRCTVLQGRNQGVQRKGDLTPGLRAINWEDEPQAAGLDWFKSNP